MGLRNESANQKRENRPMLLLEIRSPRPTGTMNTPEPPAGFCLNCRHFGDGLCNLNPPSGTPITSTARCWPKVEPSDWCGYYAAPEPAQAPEQGYEVRYNEDRYQWMRYYKGSLEGPATGCEIEFKARIAELERENEKLTAALEKAYIREDQAVKSYEEAELSAGKLRAELAEARKDSGRLDWLFKLIEDRGTDAIKKLDWTPRLDPITEDPEEWSFDRAAIDAAKSQP